MRLDLHDTHTMFEFHFDLQHTPEIVDGDQRPVAQTAKAFLGNAELDLGTVAGIPEVVVIAIVIVVIAMAVAVVTALIVIVAVVVVPTTSVVVVAIISAIVTATIAVATAMIVAVIVIREGRGRERMRRTIGDDRQADRRGYEAAEADGGNKQGFSQRGSHDFRSFSGCRCTDNGIRPLTDR